MNKLTKWIHRFPYKHPNFGVENLMKYLVIANVAVYLLAQFSNYSAISFLAFDWQSILRGEVWRLVTFVVVPSTFSALSFALMMYFYYFVGNILERQWGTGRFTLYYLSGVVLTLLGAILTGVVTGEATMFGASYVYTSMFMAFAMLYPENQVLLFFILPIKMKYLAIAGTALFAWDMIQAALRFDILGIVVPVLALMNFIVFFWDEICAMIGRQQERTRHQHSAQTVQYKEAAKRQVQQQKQGYRHKCEICGRTDVDHPNLQFRYCSRCNGYHCYCEEHIFNHTHHV